MFKSTILSFVYYLFHYLPFFWINQEFLFVLFILLFYYSIFWWFAFLSASLFPPRINILLYKEFRILVVHLWWWKVLTSFVWKYFHFPLTFEEYFHQYWILAWQIISFQNLKVLFYYHLTLIISVEKWSISIVVPL